VKPIEAYRAIVFTLLEWRAWLDEERRQGASSLPEIDDAI